MLKSLTAAFAAAIAISTPVLADVGDIFDNHNRTAVPGDCFQAKGKALICWQRLNGTDNYFTASVTEPSDPYPNTYAIICGENGRWEGYGSSSQEQMSAFVGAFCKARGF